MENNTKKKAMPFWIYIVAILILSVIALSLAFSYFGLDSCIPAAFTTNKQHRNYAKEAIRIADRYLDYECSAQEAYNDLEKLRERENELPSTDSVSSNESQIEFKTLCLSLRMLYSTTDSSPKLYNEILSFRNELAELAGVKQR